MPQVAGVATGFAICWALAWRRQGHAVAAIEERDAARFYVDRTSPLQPIRLIRTPGFGGTFLKTPCDRRLTAAPTSCWSRSAARPACSGGLAPR